MQLDILKTVSMKDKPTQIMYASNTSWLQCKTYLEAFVKAGIISEELVESKRVRPKRRYFLTEKGRTLLRRLQEIVNEMNNYLPKEAP